MANFPGSTTDYTEAKAAIPVVAPADQLSLFEEVEAIEENVGPRANGAYPSIAERLDAIEALQQALGYGTRVALIVENGTAAPTTSMHVTADILAVEGVLCGNLTDRPLDITLDMTVVGKNGRIEAASDTWWYAWVGVNPASGEVAGAMSTVSARASLDLTDSSFEGLTHWRRVGAVKRVSSALLKRRQQDATVLYDDAQSLSVSYQASWHTESAAAFVPPTSRIATLQVKNDTLNGGSAAYFSARPTTVGSGAGRQASIAVAIAGATVVAAAGFVPVRVWLNTSQQFDWQMSAAQTASFPIVTLGVTEYEDQV